MISTAISLVIRELRHANQRTMLSMRLLATTSLGDPIVMSSVWMQSKRLTNCGEMDFFKNSCLGLGLVCRGYYIGIMMRALLWSTLRASDLLRSKYMKVSDKLGFLFSF